MDQGTLSFGARAKALSGAFSAGALAGQTLFVASDQTAAIEALTQDGAGWTHHKTYRLKDLIDLPGGSEQEADIEALWATDNWLWLAGNHALVRRPFDVDDGPKKALRKMVEIRRPANRFVLARVPLTDLGKGRTGLAAKDGDRCTEQLEAGKRSSILIKWIEEHVMLAPSLALPAKEGGIDIAGMAAHGEVCWLGLRGPILRDHAVVLQLQLSSGKRGALKAKKLDDGRRFRMALLPLDGLGVRDLAILGNDLLIAAGPMGNAPGPLRLYRWQTASGLSDSMVIPPDDIVPIAQIGAAYDGHSVKALIPIDAERAILLHGATAARFDRVNGVYTADVVYLQEQDGQAPLA